MEQKVFTEEDLKKDPGKKTNQRGRGKFKKPQSRKLKCILGWWGGEMQ